MEITAIAAQQLLETLYLDASEDWGHIEEEVSTTSGIRSPNDEFEIAVCGYMPCRDGEYLESVWNTIKVPDPDPERPLSWGNVTINKKPLYPFSVVRMMYKTKQQVAVGSHLYSLGGLYTVGSDSDSDSDGDIAHPFESKRYRKVWRLDVNRPSAGWKAVPPMTFPNRYDPPSVALQGKLYVLGGFFKSQFPAEAAVKELGWMEAYDPSSNKWEPLPNPPSGFFFDADPLIFTALESKNQILVARYNHDDPICDSATFCIYDVNTRSWTKLEPAERKLFARYPDRTERRSIAVGNTLYWGLLEDEDIIVQAYELEMKIWIHGRFNIRPFVAKDEFPADNIFPASTPLLHLNNQRFCLFFLTSCYDRNTCQVSNLYLNCLILDISPINDEGKPHEQHDYYDHACYRVIDEEDNDNINYHVHVHDHFWRLYISIVSIQKYPLVNPIQLCDAVLLKQTWFLETGFSKKKEICSTEMKKRCLIPKFEFSLPSDERTQCEIAGDLQLNRDGIRVFLESPPIKQSDHQLSLADLHTIKNIGKGGAGIVRLVQHKWTGQFFALKECHMNTGESHPKLIAQEMRINQIVECPYVVPCYQSFYDGGVCSLILEYMDGGSLLDFLIRVKTIPEQYLAAICNQVLKGLLYLHQEKLIIHNDLKPSNLLINHRGEVKIADFGVSAIVESHTGMVNSLRGTLKYMSPEKIDGGNYNFKSDIWSLGILLLECATGQFPYSPSEHGEGWNFNELRDAIVKRPPPSAPADHFSQEFSSFISACVQKEPKDRESACELMTHPFIAMYEDLGIDLSSYFTSAGSPLATLENLSGISKS